MMEQEVLQEKLGQLASQASQVYVAVTGGKIQEPFTDPNVVVAQFEEHWVTALNQQAEELVARIATALGIDPQEIWKSL